jgi:hypothetical protein
MQITLQQFEQIDGLFNACLRRPAIEQVMAHPLASRDYVRNVYFRPEWELTDVCVEVVGLNAFNEYASAVDCAAHILTDCLTGKTDVVDMLEAA